MAAGGWGDCCPGHSSPKILTALTNGHFAVVARWQKVSIIVPIVVWVTKAGVLPRLAANLSVATQRPAGGAPK